MEDINVDIVRVSLITLVGLEVLGMIVFMSNA